MKINISPQQLIVIQKILAMRVADAKVFVFGSRIKGSKRKIKKHSDLDLAIISHEKLKPLTLAYLQQDFSNSFLPFRVDIVDWHQISQEFQQAILENDHEMLPLLDTR